MQLSALQLEMIFALSSRSSYREDGVLSTNEVRPWHKIDRTRLSMTFQVPVCLLDQRESRKAGYLPVILTFPTTTSPMEPVERHNRIGINDDQLEKNRLDHVQKIRL
jgi:hypothetical protein